MNQAEIGSFIAKKRRERNLTQAELAGKLGMSNKTVSKWETGKSMPDYAIVQSLCKELGISVSELMNAKEDEHGGTAPYDEGQILDLLKRTQDLESQKVSLYGIILIVMGIALMALHFAIGGSNLRDFISGTLLGLSAGVIIVGVYVVARGFSRR